VKAVIDLQRNSVGVKSVLHAEEPEAGAEGDSKPGEYFYEYKVLLPCEQGVER
jgi:hypothetical protein